MAEPILRCIALRKSFPSPAGPVEVLRDVALTVHPAEMVAILGDSGAGKTTLLHLVGGIDRPDAGRIEFRGVDVAAGSAADRARYRNRELGFIFQFHNLLPEFTALENAMMPLLIRGEERHRARTRAAAVLRDLGLAGRLDRRPTALSGGEQQRVAIGRAVAGAPSILLADEPTGNLDERNAEAVFALLLDLHRRRGMTTLLVTHSERLALRCTRVLKMEHGSLTTWAGSRYNIPAGSSLAPAKE